MRWLFDVAAIVALVWWQRSRVWPALRLVHGSGDPVKARQAQRPSHDMIAILVSRADMEARVRWALSWRATLRFTKTWAELEHVITQAPPLAVFADPLADETGDPVGHLERFSRERHVPVVLYTDLTPQLASKLLRLGQAGIPYVMFSRVDDGADRFNAVVDWNRVPPPRDGPPLVA